jgi:hypothetical protein
MSDLASLLRRPGRLGWLLIALAVVAVVGVLVVLGNLQKPQHLGETLDLEQRGTGLRTLTVYYLSADSLHVEPAARTALSGRSVRVLSQELVTFLSTPGEGLRPPLPAGTRLLHVFQEAGGSELVLDLSAEVRTAEGGSLLEDRLRLTAVARTLAENLEGVRRLRLLVEGRPLESWGRHLRLDPVLELEAWL